MSSSLNEYWAELIEKLARGKEYEVSGHRRLHQKLDWVVPAKAFMDPKGMTLKEIGFTPVKITLLKKHYAPVNVERAVSDLKWRVENRKHGSGVIYFMGEKKTGTRQDWCMTSLTISYYPQKKCTEIFVSHRTAELIKSFRADLIYLRDVVLPLFEEIFKVAPPKNIHFHFVNATLHPMYWVLTLQHLGGWRPLMKHVRENNIELFRHICYWSWRYLLDKKGTMVENYRRAAQVKEKTHAFTDPDKLKEFRGWLKAEMINNAKHYPETVQQWSKEQ